MKKIFSLLFLMTFLLGYSQPGASPTDPPTRNSYDVLSIFSGSYANQTGVFYDTFGGSTINADYTPVSPGGNPCKYYTNHSYSGIKINTAGILDISQMTKLHFDVWSPNYSSMRLKLESSTGTARELDLTGAVVPSVSTRNQWISVDLDLSTYNLGNILTSLRYIVPVTFGQNATLYIDNVYFYRPATSNPPPTITGFSVPAQTIGAAPFNLTAPTSNSSGAFTYTIAPVGVATISGNTVTVTGVGSATITASQASDGTYAAGSTSAILNVTPPAAPVPPVRQAVDIISYYSDSYTTASTPTWQGTSNNDVSISGNTTRVYNAVFTNGFITFANKDVSQMTTVHVDVFSVNVNPLWFYLNSKRITLNTPVNGWTSLDIPLSDFTSSPTGAAINLNSINTFKIENPTGASNPQSTIYIDNIYFFRPQTDTPPTLGMFTVPTKVFGDAPFPLTPPTSTSSGAWSYTISPAGIGTISGNVVTIVGGGTATITANQAPVAGTWGPGQTTAQFVVTYPEPGASPVPPARIPSRVISLYTGTPSVYANVPNYHLGQAFWSTGGGRILTEVPNGTNTALRVDGLGFMGLIDIGETGPPAIAGERRLNLTGTGMSHLHIDIYLDSPISNLFVVLLAPSDRLLNSGPLSAGWNSLSIPLTSYPGALNDVYGLKLEQNVGAARRIFVDNFYFSNDLYTFYADTDGDGFGNAASTILATTQPVGYVSNNTDCDDTNATAWQTGNFYIDFDADGYSYDNTLYPVCYGNTAESYYNLTSLGLDCDDNNAAVNSTFTFYTDADGDGFGSINAAPQVLCAANATTPPGSNLSPYNTDCSDNNAAVHPGAVDICYDGLDNDCNGNIDNVGMPGGCTPIVSTLQATLCGTTLNTIDQYIYANLVSGAQGYRFRITDLSAVNPTPVQTIDKALRVFALTQLTYYKFDTTYQIEVSIKKFNVWQPFYGAPCNVTTPATTTQVRATQCGSTLTAMTDVIYADLVPFATGYRFRVTNVIGGTSQVLDRALREFRMNLLVNPEYNSLYSVEVAVRNTDGTYLPYGPVCNITTPIFPTTFLQNSQCDYTAASTNENFYAVSYPGATTYRFKFMNTSLGYTYTFDKALRVFNLSEVPGLEPATTYSVQVSIELNGVFGPYGKVCSLTTSGSVVRAVPGKVQELPFTAVAYPNPYAESFNLNVTTSSDENISVTVYDMIGKQIEVRQVSANAINTIQIGDRYPSGVYNVIVKQGENSQNVQVIKR